jgi:hypothetical protein
MRQDACHLDPCGPGTTPRSIGDTDLKQPGHLPGIFIAGKLTLEAGAVGGVYSRWPELDEDELAEDEYDVVDVVEGNESLTGGVLIGRTLTFSAGAHCIENEFT